MGLKYGIDVETIVSVDGNCRMSCRVVGDEIEFVFGRTNDGLRLAFDGHGLLRFMRLARAMVERLDGVPGEQLPDFMVSADKASYAEHVPGGVSSDESSVCCGY